MGAGLAVVFWWPNQGDALWAAKGSTCEQLGLSSGTEFCPKTGAVVGQGSAPQLPRCTGQPQPGRGLRGCRGPVPQGCGEHRTQRWRIPAPRTGPVTNSRDTLRLQTPALRPPQGDELNRAAPAPDPQAAEPRAEMQPQPRWACTSQHSPAPPATSKVITDWDHRNAPRCAEICRELPPQGTRFRQAAWLTPILAELLGSETGTRERGEQFPFFSKGNPSWAQIFGRRP